MPETPLIQEAFNGNARPHSPLGPLPKQDGQPRGKSADWFDQFPLANVGIVTGRISNLVVFDLDSEDAVDYALARGGFPATPKAKTGKGYHLYMQHPGFEVRNRVNQTLRIDIRADGGYVAAPPSVHGSGRAYEWVESSCILDIAPAPCEPWMIDYLKTSQRAINPSPNPVA